MCASLLQRMTIDVVTANLNSPSKECSVIMMAGEDPGEPGRPTAQDGTKEKKKLLLKALVMYGKKGGRDRFDFDGGTLDSP